MGDKTKIDWCESSFNPIVGCRHDCDYCYARRIANRFGYMPDDGRLHDLNAPIKKESFVVGVPDKKQPYPYSFAPTFHRYRLDIPSHWQRPRTIFVCSMADMFGEWVPDEWIKEIFDACRRAPQHRYLFLTKNPKRYIRLAESGLLPTENNFWYGSTATTPNTEFFFCKGVNTFISIEPILEPFTKLGKKDCFVDWVIAGAETGNRKSKVIPEKAWINEISEQCKRTGVPIFMKSSIQKLMGPDFLQQYPWDEKFSKNE